MLPLNADNLDIKHVAFAVKNAEASLQKFRELLSFDGPADILDWPKSRTKVALFRVAGVEYQLCESYDPDGRFSAWIDERNSEGLHHICYAVPSIEKALDLAISKGAKLKTCLACGVKGKHPHPEGFVAFLEDQIIGLEIEFMQVYSAEELKEYANVRGI